MTYFKIREFFVHCLPNEFFLAVSDEHVLQNLFDLYIVLNELRFQLGMPIFINSCYRDEAHNQSVGGVKGSHHTKGAAADIRCDTLYMPKLLSLCFENTNITQIIQYDTFIHISIFPTKNERFYDKRKAKQNQ